MAEPFWHVVIFHVVRSGRPVLLWGHLHTDNQGTWLIPLEEDARADPRLQHVKLDPTLLQEQQDIHSDIPFYLYQGEVTPPQ